MPRLSIAGPAGPPVSYRFEKTCVTIGRSPTNDLVLDDPRASRVHAELRRTDAGWIVADRDSRNGVTLNGRPIVGAAGLRPGDEIHVGQTTLRFHAGDEPDEEPRPSAGGRTTWTSEGEGTESEPVFVGQSSAIRDVLEQARRVAGSDASVLLLGENGTGKELAARLLHSLSPRASGPFVVVDCPALPLALFESELFGVEKGVATGVDARPGLFETAQGGTLLLDEVADLELAAQAKLLRVLQERTIQRVGGRVRLPLDVRIVAATNHDLEADVAAGRLRRDLLHRLEVITIRLPPLRDRREDVPVLARHFLSRPGGPAARLGDDAEAALLAHEFPGNVRELEHAMEHARWHARDGVIRLEDLPASLRARPGSGASSPDAIAGRLLAGEATFWDAVAEPFLRRELSREDARSIVASLHERAGRSYKEMARLLGAPDEHKRLLDFVGRHGLGQRRAGTDGTAD